jgi:DNA-binding transcriptional regulator LsrR (DeoR family)
MSAAAHVSHLYFKRRLTKQEIGERLGISRFKVARLIEEALETGVVRIQLDEPVALHETLAHELERTFGLELAVVVSHVPGSDPETWPVELVARAAASWLPELLRAGDVLGVAFGSTIQRVARELASGPPVPVVQICGHVAGVGSGQGPLELTWQLAERLGGAYHPLPVPALVASRAARDELMVNEALAPTVAMFERVTVALVGIGSLEGEGRSSLLASGVLRREEVPGRAVGDLLVHLFDAEGHLVDTPLADRAIQLSADRLRAARVVAVAGGPGKLRAIQGALRSGMVDVLVTDEANAKAMA